MTHYINIINVICNCTLAIASILAIIWGCIYFNKKLKIYLLEENNRLKIIGLDIGNGACHISKVIYIRRPSDRVDYSFT